MKDYAPPQIIKEKFWIITCTTIWVCYPIIVFFFSHLLILEYPNHHQNLISSSLYYPGPRPKILSQSVHNFLSNVHKQTNQRYQKHNLLCQGGNEGASISRPLVVHLVLGGIFFFKSDRKILNDVHFCGGCGWMVSLLACHAEYRGSFLPGERKQRHERLK